MNAHHLLKPLATATLITTALLTTNVLAQDDMAVKITPELASIEVQHGDEMVTVMRNQDQKATVDPNFAPTSRKCPPFCINPMQLAPGVETIGELEMLDYLKRVSDGDDSVLVIDSRTTDWVKRGTIPGSVNIPWTSLNPAKGADPFSIADILEGDFGRERGAGCSRLPVDDRHQLHAGVRREAPQHDVPRSGGRRREGAGLQAVVPYAPGVAREAGHRHATRQLLEVGDHDREPAGVGRAGLIGHPDREGGAAPARGGAGDGTGRREAQPRRKPPARHGPAVRPRSPGGGQLRRVRRPCVPRRLRLDADGIDGGGGASGYGTAETGTIAAAASGVSTPTARCGPRLPFWPRSPARSRPGEPPRCRGQRPARSPPCAG